MRPPSQWVSAEPRTSFRANGRAANSIVIHNAREHNLKNIDVSIPRDRFTVVTGVSGSGKSTLAFDILFQSRDSVRHLESLNAYARQFVQPAARPDVDAIFGIPPTVAIEQRTSRGGRKSTCLATLTEMIEFPRLLYVKLGTQYCPDCDSPIEPQSVAAIAARLLRDYRGHRITLLAPLVVARKGFYTDLAKWAAKKGYKHLRVDVSEPAHGALASIESLQGDYDRAARRNARGQREIRCGAARFARACARLWQRLPERSGCDRGGLAVTFACCQPIRAGKR